MIGAPATSAVAAAMVTVNLCMMTSQRVQCKTHTIAAPICDELGEKDRKLRALVPIASTNPQFPADLFD
jgi:hypothetical protein